MASHPRAQQAPCPQSPQPDQIGSMMHTRPDLCKGILSTVSSSYALAIKESAMTGAGSGLFTMDEIPKGAEIFRSQPLVNCRSPSITHVCDYCLASSKSAFHKDGRFLTEEDKALPIKPCAGCKVARYCSQVRPSVCWPRRFKHGSRQLADARTDVPEEGLESIPQVRVQDSERDTPAGTKRSYAPPDSDPR